MKNQLESCQERRRARVNKETLRSLSPDHLVAVHGGVGRPRGSRYCLEPF